MEKLKKRRYVPLKVIEGPNALVEVRTVGGGRGGVGGGGLGRGRRRMVIL